MGKENSKSVRVDSLTFGSSRQLKRNCSGFQVLRKMVFAAGEARLA
jgi:hypothetical protein